MAISEDRRPQIEAVFGGKHEHREAEKIDAEEFIGKKGLQAKGKKVSQYELKEVRFIEPLPVEEEEEDALMPEADNQAGEIDNTGVEDPTDTGEDDDQPTLF